jgi:hypothetical protein
MAETIVYPCLPNWQRDCRCDLIARLERRDCGQRVPPKPSTKR